MNIQQALFFSFLKKAKAYKTKKIINISYLIMVPIKMRLLISLVLSQYGLACKYIIISQLSMCNIVSSYFLDQIALSQFILHRALSGR